MLWLVAFCYYTTPLIDYAASKSKFVMWAVSHCGTIRDKYVKKLLNYISVEIFGKCSYIYGQYNQCLKSLTAKTF